MFRRSLLLALVPLVASCAATTPTPTPTPSSDVHYLDGITSQYSVRLDELHSAQKLASDDLQNALVAGDDQVAVAASVFERGGYITLDLVVLNRSGEPVRLARSDITLYDYMGHKLEPVSDWTGAADVGLRSRVRLRRDFVDLERIDTRLFDPVEYQAADLATGAEGKGGRRTTALEPPQGQRNVAVTRIGELEPQDREVHAPTVLHVQGHQTRPYWAYWKADAVEYPVTVVLKMQGRNLLYRFDR